MRPAMVWLVARRALIETFRDRRTLVGFVALPLLSVFFLTVMRGEIEDEVADLRQVSHHVVVDGATIDGELLTFLRRDGNLVTVTKPDGHADVERLVREREFPVGLIVDPGAEDALRAGRQAHMRIVTGERSIRAQFARATLEKALAAYAEKVLAERLAAAGLSREAGAPLAIFEMDVRSERERKGSGLAELLPFLVFAQILSLGHGIASELTVSQRERRTLEAIAVTPLTRREIVSAHWLTAFGTAVAGGILTVVAALGAFTWGGGEGVVRSLPPGWVGILPVILAFAATSSAVQILAGIAARTASQMGFAMAPLMLLTVGGLGVLQATNPDPAAWVAALPLAGPAITVFTLLSGTAAPGSVAIAAASGLVWAAVAIMIADRVFRSERALQRATA